MPSECAVIIALVCEVPLCPQSVSVCFLALFAVLSYDIARSVRQRHSATRTALRKRNMDMQSSAGFHASASATSTGLRITAEHTGFFFTKWSVQKATGFVLTCFERRLFSVHDVQNIYIFLTNA